MRKNAVIQALLAAGLIASTPLASAAGNLVFCSEGSPAGFDPGLYTTGTDFDAAAETVFNRLSQFERGGTKVIPGLAEKWNISEDGLSYTFHLRPKVKFHTTEYFKPSRDFNADDVLFTFQRMLDKDHPFRKAYPSEFPYFTDMGMDANIAKIEKLDDMTVKFSLNEVDAAFIQNLAMSPNPNPTLKAQLASVRMQKLKAGECQVTLFPRPADLDALKKDPNLDMPEQAGFNVGYIAYNVTHPPFDKLEVRQALDMAVNKQGIIDAVYQSAGQLAVNGMPPTQWSYDDSIKDPAYNPEKAKELLKAAGVKEGAEITLWAMPVQRPYNPNAKLMAEMLQSDWAKVGIKAKIVSYEWGEYLKRAKAGEHDAMLIGWSGDNGDPDNWLGTLYGCDAVDGNNFSKWCHADYDKLVKAAKRVTDTAERTELYKQAQVILKREVPITPIAHSTVYQPMSKKVVDFKISPFALNSFYGVGVK